MSATGTAAHDIVIDASTLTAMLSYRHAFHAGNFADVFKHVVLTMLLTALRRKDKPFFFLDTHAGAGRYDLYGEMARKHREHEGGIARLWSRDDLADTVAAYLDVVRAVNSGSHRAPSSSAGRGKPGVKVNAGRAHAPSPPPPPSRGEESGCRWYPGSPRIAQQFLRKHDRMLLCELHSSDAPVLRREFEGDRRVTVLNEDGYHALRARLPPHERRGLVLVDPSYERRDEHEHVLRGIADGHRRWATGMYAVWYPIMPKIALRKLHDGFAEAGIRKVLVTELCIFPDDNPLGLNGSGLLLINPPWQLDGKLKALLPWLWRVLSPEGQGRWRADWLVPE